MRNEWRELTFLHWSYDPDEVQRLLPNGLRVETWNDKAWVGLVPFRMHVRTRRGPYLPWISHFPETNLRTYVRGPNGEVGVWFFSLEASRLPAVVIGRVGYGVWYHWARMKIQHAVTKPITSHNAFCPHARGRSRPTSATASRCTRTT